MFRTRMDSPRLLVGTNRIVLGCLGRFGIACICGVLIISATGEIAQAAMQQEDDIQLQDLDGEPVERQVPERLENLPHTLPQPLQQPAPDYQPDPHSALENLWNGSRQFVIPPFGRPPDIQFEIEDGRISLVARSAPLRDVLSLLAEKHGLNLVMAQDVISPITITLNQVTLMDALEAVVSVAGYTWTTHRGIVHVSSISSNNVLTPHVQGRLTRVFELDYVSAIDLDLAIKGMLSPSGRSEVMLSDKQDNRRTKEVIVVEDFPAFIHRIEQYVAQVDVLPRQVLIQVHVLEIDLDHNERHGVNLEMLLRVAGGTIEISTVGFANPNAEQALFAEINGTDVNALLEALETYTDSETLASPRVIALNGQESTLQVGEKLGYRTSTTTETSTQESVNFLDVGVVLTVTPRITREDNVLLYIRPKVSSGQVSEGTGLPSESTSEVETNLVLRSGQGIVIGGLIQERDSFEESQAPIIGDIKGLGHLFKRRSKARERSEIIFVLVPHILPPGCGPDPWYGNGGPASQSEKGQQIDFRQGISCGGNGQYGSGLEQHGYQDAYQNCTSPHPVYQPHSQTIYVPSNSTSSSANVRHRAKQAEYKTVQPSGRQYKSFGKRLFSGIDLNPFNNSKKNQQARGRSQRREIPAFSDQRTGVVQTGYQSNGRHAGPYQANRVGVVPNHASTATGVSNYIPNGNYPRQYSGAYQIRQSQTAPSRTASGVSFSFSDKSTTSRR